MLENILKQSDWKKTNKYLIHMYTEVTVTFWETDPVRKSIAERVVKNGWELDQISVGINIEMEHKSKLLAWHKQNWIEKNAKCVKMKSLSTN